MSSLWKQHPTESADTPFEPGARHDVVVIGAGLTGLATAYELARTGVDVALLERGGIGELASGSNTGKVSLLQGTTLSTLRSGHPASLVRAYVDANRDGFAWMTDTAEHLGVPLTSRTAYTYAQAGEGRRSVAQEYEAAREAGLAVRLVGEDELRAAAVPMAAAVALDDQRAVDPMRMLAALADAFVAAGGTLHLGVEVSGVKVFPEPRVETARGPIFASRVVVATGIPILDRGLYWAKVSGMRSACVSFTLTAPLPDGMYLSADEPTRSVRTVLPEDGPADVAQIVVGGAGHPVGRAESERAMLDELSRWAQQTLTVGEETHRWSAQDYTSHNRIPFIGTMPRTLGRVRFATGYAKWGLTNAPAAALRIVSELRGEKMSERPRWMTQIGTRLTMPADIAQGAAENAKVGLAAATGWAGAEAQAVPVPQPAEGEGVVAQRAGRPVAISTTNGETRAVSAVCPHLGGILEWNDLECTWDCPLHASRFTASGERIEGPATRGLRPVD
ncbi:FAD-dependent oxidoreductase [Microbacterium sp. LMI1x-1-1.1]|uniref:FAD-dependent oxidoreductase n=1 Tax=Microbacterium sp. LMI1x-1-1.1 TaxID=3135246 RepID=UPI00344446F9